MQEKEQYKVGKTGDQRASDCSKKKRNIEILDGSESREDIRCLDDGTGQLKQQQPFEEDKKFESAEIAESAVKVNHCSVSDLVGNARQQRSP